MCCIRVTCLFFFFSSSRRHTRWNCDWSPDVCSSDLPRPIGWVSTIGADGAVNLAPYSYFNAVSDNPPTVMFSSDGPKDSATFAQATEEFVWNMVTRSEERRVGKECRSRWSKDHESEQ